MNLPPQLNPMAPRGGAHIDAESPVMSCGYLLQVSWTLDGVIFHFSFSVASVGGCETAIECQKYKRWKKQEIFLIQ